MPEELLYLSLSYKNFINIILDKKMRAMLCFALYYHSADSFTDFVFKQEPKTTYVIPFDTDISQSVKNFARCYNAECVLLEKFGNISQDMGAEVWNFWCCIHSCCVEHSLAITLYIKQFIFAFNSRRLYIPQSIKIQLNEFYTEVMNIWERNDP